MDMYEAAVGKVAVAEEEEGANSQNECLNVRRVLPVLSGRVRRLCGRGGVNGFTSSWVSWRRSGFIILSANRWTTCCQIF